MQKNYTASPQKNNTVAMAAPEKAVGLFLPIDDLRIMRRERCAKASAKKQANDDHARDVAADVSRMMSLVYTNNQQRTAPDVRDPETLTDDLVRKLLIVHLGEPRKGVWTGLRYNAQTLVDIENEQNTVLEAFSAPGLDTAAQQLPTQVPAAFWHHLFEFLAWDYVVSSGGGDGTMVSFRKPRDTVVRNADLRKNPNMALFARFYHKARKAGIEHKDVPMAFFVASALKRKNGRETLEVAQTGVGIDKEHARFSQVSPAQLRQFYDEVIVNEDYNQERTPSVLSQDQVLAEYVEDWVALLNFVDIRLPNVGLVVQTGVTPDSDMLLYATNAGVQERRAKEQAEQTAEAPGVGEEEDGDDDDDDDDDDDEEGDGKDEGATQPIRAHLSNSNNNNNNISNSGVRMDALRQLEAHPMVREVRSKWQLSPSGAPSARLVGVLLARQLTASRSERERVLASELGFKQPAQHHAMLETPLNGLDAERLNMDAWHTLTLHMANSLDSTTALPDVDAFTRRVFNAPGVAASERPVSRTEQVRRYLAIYGNGSDDAQAWRDVWRAKWPLSKALENAIAARVIDTPRVPVETQEAFARAAMGKVV